MPRHTKSIMIQGTISNTGRSILAAGLCRTFYWDSYRTALFRSRNMALNFYITPEGLEMGRAQATQTEAAGIVSRADMNPILLKSTTDVGNQVTVHGISRGNMRARDCFTYKKSLVLDVMAPYRRLEEQYDIIVIEGAENPAEINLKPHDIASMGVADMANVPVPLVRDIDRGSVFTQLYGTVSLLTEKERKRVKGLIINKFRGSRSILEPGISMLEALCHISVVGVILYMDVDIGDEDSLSSRLEIGKSKTPAAMGLAVIRFSCTSDFTGSNVFSGIPGVSLRHVTKAYDLGGPNMVIPPDTRNTIQDLLWMRRSGSEAAILKLADRQVPVWGTCGGYQMMRGMLEDVIGVESDLPSRTVGMGLLPLKTKSGEEKIRTQVEGAFGKLDNCLYRLSGKSIEKYEIHMGHTYINREEGAADTARIIPWYREPKICRPIDYAIETGEGRVLPRQVRMDEWNRGNVYGTYVYGISDDPQVTRIVAKALVAAKGLYLEQTADMDYRAYREQQYDKLAESLREHLDMDAVYRITNISPKEKGEEKPGGGYTVGTDITGRCREAQF